MIKHLSALEQSMRSCSKQSGNPMVSIKVALGSLANVPIIDFGKVLMQAFTCVGQHMNNANNVVCCADNETRLTKKVKELNGEIVGNAAKVQTALRLSEEDQTTIVTLKKEVEKAWKLVDASHEKVKPYSLLRSQQTTRRCPA